eukprot:3789917-Pleurochrysis_carterae.AAC.1
MTNADLHETRVEHLLSPQAVGVNVFQGRLLRVLRGALMHCRGAVTGSLAGAACRPSSLRPSAVSFACTHARDVAQVAGSPPPAVV